MTWHDDFQVWLSEEQSLENAQLVANHLLNTGQWSKESICALIGNMRHESSINPNMYEYGYEWEQDRGYGLVQWTPRSKYWDWAIENGLDPEDGNSQLDRIDYEVENNIQWIPTAEIDNMTFEEFRSNSGDWSIDYLTECFTWGYERPNREAGEDSMASRQSFARLANDELNWSGGTEPEKPIIDLSPITNFFEQFTEDLSGALSDLLSTRLYQYDFNKKTMGNHFLKMHKEMDNVYKLSVTLNFKELIDTAINEGKDALGDIIGGIIPDDGGNGTDDIYFPVDPNGEGINFWYPPYDSDLTANMDYGERTSGAFHAGYDIGGGGIEGHNIYATTSGTVREVREGTGWGWLIIIDHDTDEYSSLYAHLVTNSNVVNEGDKVQAGQKIATMGASGGNYAIHLHYELSPTGVFRPNPESNTIDPKNYLKITGNNQTGLKSPV